RARSRPPITSLSLPRPHPPPPPFPYTTLFRSVISSRTSGALDLIQHGENGWLFDLGAPQTLHQAVDCALLHPELRSRLAATSIRSEEHTSELQSRFDLVCRLLLEKKTSKLCCV